MSNDSHFDIGSQTRRWGPFHYAEGYGFVQVERRGGGVQGTAKVKLHDNGYVGVETSSGQELYLGEDGLVSIMPKQAGLEVCVSVDGLVTVHFADQSRVMVTPDGQIHRVTADDVTIPLIDAPVAESSQGDAVTQSASAVNEVNDPAPTDKDAQVDWLVTRARAGEVMTWQSVKQSFSLAGIEVSDRTIQHLLVEAVQRDPEAFLDAEEVEPVPATKADRIEHIIKLAKSGKEISTKALAEQFGTTVRSVQRYVLEAVQKEPKAFLDAAEAEGPAKGE